MLDQLIALISAGNWLPLALLVLTLVQTWMQPSSKFPITIPERFQPLFAIVTGQLYAVLTVVAAHQPWGHAVAYGLAATALTLLTSHAVWESGNTPPWAKALAFILDQLRGDAHSPATTNPPTPPKSVRPPPAAITGTILVLGFIGLVGGALLGATLPLSGCSSAANKVAGRTALDLATADCVVLQGDVGNGTVDSICATEEELSPFVKHLFDARRKAVASTGKMLASTAVKHPDDLPPIKGIDACTVTP